MGDHTLDRHLLHRRVSGKWLIASGSYKQSTISAFFRMLELDCCLNNAVRYFSVPFASLKTFATHRILSTPWNVSFIIELRSYLNLTSSSLFRLNSAIYSVGSKHLPLNTKILQDEIIFCMGDDKNYMSGELQVALNPPSARARRGRGQRTASSWRHPGNGNIGLNRILW